MIQKVQKTLCLAAAAYALLVTSFAQAQSMPTRHVREEVRTGKVLPVGMLPANQIMNLDLVLPLRDPAGLKRFLGALYNPASPLYQALPQPAGVHPKVRSHTAGLRHDSSIRERPRI